MANDEYVFSINIKVRDYELDSEGIVNNANYLHYLEYTRHEFCEANGFSFGRMAENGIVPVLSRAVIDYLTPLRSGDVAESLLRIERRGPRFIFNQLMRKPDGTPVVKAEITCVTLENGRLSRGEALAEIFKKYLNGESDV